MLKKLGYALAALVATVGIAIAAGQWNGYPVVGNDGTLCLSQGNGGVCNQFEPVGNADVPPTSVIPSDTRVTTQGAIQTQMIPAVLTGATVLDAAPLTGTTITLPAGTAKLMLVPAGTIATLTVTLPAAASCLDGQEFFIYSSQTVTALTVTPGSGTTLTPTITTVTAAAPVKLVYNQNATAWQLF